MVATWHPGVSIFKVSQRKCNLLIYKGAADSPAHTVSFWSASVPFATKGDRFGLGSFQAMDGHRVRPIRRSQLGWRFCRSIQGLIRVQETGAERSAGPTCQRKILESLICAQPGFTKTGPDLDIIQLGKVQEAQIIDGLESFSYEEKGKCLGLLSLFTQLISHL